MIEEADDLRLRGNHEFSKGNYDNALSLYTASIDTLEKTPANGRATLQSLETISESSSAAETLPSTVSKDASLLATVLCNRSATYYLQEEYESAKDDAAAALKHAPKNIKAVYRLAKALVALQQFDAALECLQHHDILSDGSVTTKLDLDAAQEKSFAQLQQQIVQLKQKEATSVDSPLISLKVVPQDGPRKVSIKDFTKHETLGHGNFSEIIVVQHKQTSERFALKQITKKQAADLAKRQHPNVYNEIQMERHVLMDRLPPTGCSYIVRMYYAFQDYNTLYFLMDLHLEVPDLWNQCQWRDNFSETNSTKKWMLGAHRSCIRMWMWQLVDALEHLHRHGIVHRDLKTENVLLNERGHIVVIDFGTAKDLVDVTYNGPEFVGTPDFMCPEAVTGIAAMEEVAKAKRERPNWIGADHAADLWALGCMLYLMQTGMTPFWCPSPYLAFLKIKRGSCLRRPVGIVEDECWDLISSLVQQDPASRLGYSGFEVVSRGLGSKRTIVEHPTGVNGKTAYDIIRQHKYFDPVREEASTNNTQGHSPENREPLQAKTVMPSLLDLCVRPLAQSIYQDSLDYSLCDDHPPGDGSKRHDVLQLGSEERAAVLHVLDRLQRLSDSRLYDRFFENSTFSRLYGRIRKDTCDFVGYTQMNDEQGKSPKARMNDPYGTPAVALPDIRVVHLTNPLFSAQATAGSSSEAEIKHNTKLLKRSISHVNKTRPQMVVVTAGTKLSEKCQKLLTRISDSIPLVVQDGSVSPCFQFWISGVQCLALATCAAGDEDNDEQLEKQLAWVREQMEQCRLSKHPLLCFVDTNPQNLRLRLLKRLARGRTLIVSGLSTLGSADELSSTLLYKANELVPRKRTLFEIVGNENKVEDDMESLRSVDSDEEDDDRDSFSTKLQATLENGVRVISIDPNEPDVWHSTFTNIQV